MNFVSDEEKDIKLKKLIQDLSDSFLTKNRILANQTFRVIWNYYFNSVVIKTTKKRNEMILPVLFDIITTYPVFMPNLQSSFCILFSKLLRKPKYFPDGLHFSLEKVLHLYKMLFCQKERLFMKKNQSNYFDFFSKVRFFFNEDDAKFLIRNYFYRLGNFDVLSLKYLTIICRFFPPKYFKMIINDLLILLRNSVSNTHSNAIISFVYNCVLYENYQYSQMIEKSENGAINFERFDWIPYLETFYNYALLFLKPKVSINGLNLSANFQTSTISISGITNGFDEIYADYISKLIPLLIVDGKQGDETLKYFEKLIGILAPLFFTTSNCESINQVQREDCGNTSKLLIICNNNEIEFTLFIQSVITEFHANNINSLRKSKSNKINDDSKQNSLANQHQIKEFVRIVLPIIQTAIFRSNQYIQKIIINSIRYLAELDFQQVGQLLLEQSIENIIDIEMSHFSITCIEIVKQLIPSIITNKNILIETKEFFPKIIYSSIECLSNVNENIYSIGLSILGTICQFFEADEKKEELTNEEIQKLENCRKTIIQSLESTFDQFIEYTINYEFNSKDSNEILINEPQMKPFYFFSYFMSFEDSFIESKVPFLIDTIDQNMDKCFISSALFSLFESKPILFDFILPKMLDRLDKAINDKDKKKKKYFSLIISKLYFFSPCFIPYINDIKKRIDILIEECTLNSFKCVASLLLFVKNYAERNAPFLVKGNPKNIQGIILSDKEKVSKKKWEWLGKEIEDLKIYNFSLTDEIIIEQLDYCIQILQKLENIFFQDDENKPNSINFKIQKQIYQIFCIFGRIFESKGQFCQSEPKSYKNLKEDTPGVTKIDLHIKKIELIFRDIIIKGLKKCKDNDSNSQKLLLIINLAYKYFCQEDSDVELEDLSIDGVNNFKSRFKNKGKNIMLQDLVIPYSLSSSIGFLYKAEYDEEIIDLIYEISHTMNSRIFDLSISIVSCFGNINEKVYSEMAIKELQVIETKKKILSTNNTQSEPINKDEFLTEEQCITALTFLACVSQTKLFYENEYLVRILKAIVNLKYDKKWNISKYLLNLYNGISLLDNSVDIKDDQIWRDLINSIIPNESANDSEKDPSKWMTYNKIFFKVLDFIARQKPPITPKFFKFLLNTCFNLYEPNRIICLVCLSNIFARMKPITKKIQVKEVPKDIFFDDRCTIYFNDIVNKNPDLYYLFTIYEGQSEFDKSDGFQPIRDVIFDFFTEEKIGLFIDSIAFFLNEKSTSNEEEINDTTGNLLIIFEHFSKGLAKILGIKIVPLVKEKLFDIALNKSGPLLSVLFCIFKGVWRASSHWSEEENKILQDELLIPILHIFFFKRNSADAFQMLESTASIICQRRDVRRFNWLFDFIMNSIVKISKKPTDIEKKDSTDFNQSLNSENESILFHLIDFAASLLYTIYDNSYSEKYVYYLTEKVLPAFRSQNNDFDLDNYSISTLSSLSRFCSSLINTNLINRKEINDDSSLPSWASIPFELIFDVQYKKKRYDKLALFLIELINPASIGLFSFIPFISDRIEQIFTILSNLTTKFQKHGPNLILQIGLLHWEKYPDLLINTVLKKIKDVIIPSLAAVQHGWWIKCNIVTLLHVICFRNLFILPNETYKMIMKEILPLLICEKNENVRESSMNLLIFLVNVVYCGQFDIISKECLAAFEKIKSNNNSNELMNKEFTIATSCALLSNLPTLINSCPKWLPLIFNELENCYFRGTSFKNVIQKSVKNFWIRHGAREIPELEEYRFSLCESYYA